LAYYQWDSSLETGYESIDNQHKQLVSILNALLESCHNGTGREKLEQSLDFLIGYAIKHFNDEEQLQVAYQYPDYDRHKQIHNEFKQTVKDMYERLAKESVSDTMVDEVCVFMGNWVVTHIQGEDFALASYIKNREHKAGRLGSA
jgi:hemerythrin-like metal-binding protein